MLKIFFQLIARLCEQSLLFRDFVRKIHFKGKVVAVSEIRPEFLPQGEIIDESNGLKFIFNLKDDVQKLVYFNVYERRDIQLALSLIPKGGVCMDVGANIGFFTLNFARHVGEAGRVYAFEPSPKVCHRLQENCRLNQFEDRVIVNEVALSNNIGEAIFSISNDDNSGWGHIGTDSRFSEITVPTSTLDRFFDDNRLTHIDFMKVDIEGAEDDFIKGAKAVLTRKQVDYILMEFCKMNRADVVARVAELNKFGYTPIDKSGILPKIEKGVIDSEHYCGNFLFTAK